MADTGPCQPSVRSRSESAAGRGRRRRAHPIRNSHRPPNTGTSAARHVRFAAVNTMRPYDCITNRSVENMAVGCNGHGAYWRRHRVSRGWSAGMPMLHRRSSRGGAAHRDKSHDATVRNPSGGNTSDAGGWHTGALQRCDCPEATASAAANNIPAPRFTDTDHRECSPAATPE